MASPPSSDESRAKTLAFMQRLLELSHALQSLSKRMEATIGVTAAQRFAIRWIGRTPEVTAGELADAMRLHPSTLTGILRRLEEQGAISRRADREDGRRARLTLTARGKALDAEQRPTVEAAVRRALGKCSPADAAATRRVLATVVAELAREVDESD